MSDIETRMTKLMEEQADEGAPSADEMKMKEVAMHVVLGLLPSLDQDTSIDDHAEMLAGLLKKLGGNKAMIKAAIARYGVGQRALKASKNLAKTMAKRKI